VRVELHGVSNNIGHFVIAPVLHPLHGVQDSSLYRFEPVCDVGYGTLQNYIRGVFQKPVFEHAGQAVLLVSFFSQYS